MKNIVYIIEEVVVPNFNSYTHERTFPREESLKINRSRVITLKTLQRANLRIAIHTGLVNQL